MKTKKQKNIIKTVAFVLIFSLVFTVTTGIFQRKWYSDYAESDVFDNYYKCPKDSIEMLIFGNSQVVNAIDTIELYNNYGIYSYVLGSPRCSIMTHYYWFLEAMKRQHNVKSVVIDMSMINNTEYTADVAFRSSIGLMRPSVYKYRAVYDYCKYFDIPDNEDVSFLDMYTSYVFSLYKYHTRWNELKQKDFNRKYDRSLYNGYMFPNNVYTPTISYDEFIVDTDTEDYQDQFYELEAVYLDKLIEACQSRNIEVLLIKTPKTSWNITGHEYCQGVAEKYGIDFFDFTSDYYFKAAGLDYENDLHDMDHLNVRGAIKLTDYLADYLTQKSDYTDCRDLGYDSQETIDKFTLKENLAKMRLAGTEDMFFEWIPTENTVVAVQSDGNISDAWTKDEQALLDKLGLDVDIASLQNKNYLAVIKDGEVVYQKANKSAVQYSCRLSNQKKLSFTSDGEDSVATLGSKTVSFSKNGLHITVYNNQSCQLAVNTTFVKTADNTVGLRRESLTLQ